MISNLTEVPPNWIKVRFDEIVEIVKDRIDNPSNSGLEYFIGLEHLDTDCIRIKRFGFAEDVKSSKFICKKGDILFGRRRTYLRKLAISDRDAVVSTDAMIFRPIEDKIYPDFLPCFMQSSIFWKTVHANSEGSMSPRIKWKTLAKQEFWIPTIEEQKRISEILWSIEENAENNESLTSTTEALKKGLLNELLTKGIGHEKFKKSEFGEIPEEWEARELVDFTKPKCDSFYDGDWILSEDLKTGNDVRLIQLSDIGQGVFLDKSNKYISNHRCKELNCFMLQEGDVVISRMAEPVARSFIVPKLEETWITAVDVCVARVNESIANKEYLNYLMNSDYMKSQAEIYAVGSTRIRISKKNLQKIKVPFPPKVEQEAIVNIIGAIDFMINNSYWNSHILFNLKKKLTNNFISGKLLIPKEVL